MKTFGEFLKERAETARDPQNKVENKKREWIAVVDQLIAQAKEWLEETDRETRILRLVVDDDYSVKEEELGIYNIPCLQIWLGTRVAELRPIARNVVGGVDQGGIHIRAQGRVDITDGTNKFILYRISNEGQQDRWKLVDPNRATVRDLDRSTFEAAVQNLLE